MTRNSSRGIFRYEITKSTVSWWVEVSWSPIESSASSPDSCLTPDREGEARRSTYVSESEGQPILRTGHLVSDRDSPCASLRRDEWATSLAPPHRTFPAVEFPCAARDGDLTTAFFLVNPRVCSKGSQIKINRYDRRSERGMRKLCEVQISPRQFANNTEAKKKANLEARFQSNSENTTTLDPDYTAQSRRHAQRQNQRTAVVRATRLSGFATGKGWRGKKTESRTKEK